MFEPKDYVFVLWSDEFEELPATAFVTELREVGLRVKLVSFDRQRIRGIHGLTLHPDLSLEQALPLADKAVAVIIPSGSLGPTRFENDPRLRDFFGKAAQAGAKFVIGHTSNLANSKLFSPSIKNNILIYPDHEALVEFARQLASSLSSICYPISR